jgi:hypothetical protein
MVWNGRPARGGVDQPFDEAIILDKLAQNTHDTFPSMATELAAVVTGDRRAEALPAPGEPPS